MNLLKIVLMFSVSTLLTACGGPDTSSGTAGFFDLGTPQTFNKLSEKDEKRASDVLVMVDEVFKSLGNEALYDGVGLTATGFKRGDYQPRSFRNEIRNNCLLLDNTEKKSNKTYTTWRVDDVNKSIQSLDKTRGEELIGCPVELSASISDSSAKTNSRQDMTSFSRSVAIEINKHKEMDRELTTASKIVYKLRDLSPVTKVTASTSKNTTSRDYNYPSFRRPGKKLESSSTVVHIVYKEDDKTRSANVYVDSRTMLSKKQVSNRNSHTYGRVLKTLKVVLDNGKVATIENSMTYNGDLDKESYTKVNGKLVLENGKKVEEETTENN